MNPLHPELTGLPDDGVVEVIECSTRSVIRLQDALSALGITLPSLGIDLPSCCGSLDPRPLVELGRCNLETATALTAALRKAASR
jgi:hypothetical protein